MEEVDPPFQKVLLCLFSVAVTDGSKKAEYENVDAAVVFKLNISNVGPCVM